MLKQLLRCALSELRQGRPAVMAAIVESHGSTPRSAGAAMIVGRSGVLAGTIGGGEMEYCCAKMAMAPEHPVMTFTLDNQQAASLGMVCGGSAKVLFSALQDIAMLENALEQLDSMAPGCLMLPLDGSHAVLCSEGKCPSALQQVNFNGYPCLPLPLMEPGRIFLMGGGHVSLALSRILDVLEYPYIVIDDREDFSGAERFPNAVKTITSDFAGLSSVLSGELAPGSQDCVCIMTRGHLADTEALRFALKTSAGYIGVMGSRRKRERIFSQLAQEGFTDAESRICTPIGLSIGGKTPAEIAVSIAAQLVQFRNTTG